MKKIIWISLILLIVSLSCETEEVRNTNTYEICEGSSYRTAYTVRGGKDVCEGSSYRTVFTIRGNEICEGSSYRTVFTIRR